jgi:flagellin-like hook-associated protein FlgL
MQSSLTRLSTGLRINSAADDPAGLIAANHLKSEIVDIQAQRQAAQMDYYKAAIADASYGAMADIVHEAQGVLLSAAGGPSPTKSDLESAQTQLDSFVTALNHLSGSMTFGTSRLLDGSTTLGQPGKPPSDDDPAGTPSTLLTLARTDASTVGTVSYRLDPNDPGSTVTLTLADLAAGGKLSLTNPAKTSDGTGPLIPDGKRMELAQQVLDASVTQLATQRAATGSFMRYTVEAYGNVLDITEENLTDALSQIQDTDYAMEMANYIRQRSLADSATAVLAIGNARAQNTLALLAPL